MISAASRMQCPSRFIKTSMQKTYFINSRSLAPQRARSSAYACLWRINAQSETKHMHALVSSLADYIYIVVLCWKIHATHTYNRSLRIIGLKLPRITRHLTPRDDITFTCTSLQVCFMFNVIIAVVQENPALKSLRASGVVRSLERVPGTWMFASERDAHGAFRLNGSKGASLFFLLFPWF